MTSKRRRALTGDLTWQGRYYGLMGYRGAILTMNGDELVSLTTRALLVNVPNAVRIYVHNVIEHPTDYDYIEAGRDATAHWQGHDDGGEYECGSVWCNL